MSQLFSSFQNDASWVHDAAIEALSINHLESSSVDIRNSCCLCRVSYSVWLCSCFPAVSFYFCFWWLFPGSLFSPWLPSHCLFSLSGQQEVVPPGRLQPAIYSPSIWPEHQLLWPSRFFFGFLSSCSKFFFLGLLPKFCLSTYSKL